MLGGGGKYTFPEVSPSALSKRHTIECLSVLSKILAGPLEETVSFLPME